MPNRWESSTRPLSVKTVYVNGSRHAILSQEDPLLRSGIFSFKKQSRPNSSMSILSISSSQSQDSVSVARIRSSKSETPHDGHGKDISSMLQGCFIKLRLASSTEQKMKKGGLSLTHSEQVIKTNYPEGNHCKAKNCHSCENFSEENKLAEATGESNNCCYVYDFENKKRKKNYCFVKITSGKPPHFINDCSCEKNSGKAQGLCDSKGSDKNNYVISATIHNLIMGADKNENLSHELYSAGDTGSCEEPWDTSLAKNLYNPLPERVLQWLNLTKKQKNREYMWNGSSEDIDSLSNVERISAGKTFIDEFNNSRYCEKLGNKINIKTAVRKIMRRQMSEEDVETEVKTEENVETVLSMQTVDGNWECAKERISPVSCGKSEILAEEKESNGNHLLEEGQPNEKHEVSGIPTKIDPTSLVAALLSNSVVNRLNFTMSPVDVQELLEKRDSRFRYQNKEKLLREKRDCSAKGSKWSEAGGEDGNEDEKFKITGVKFLDRNESCGFNEITACQWMKNLKESGKTIKNRNLNEEFEKYQEGINNRNITRSGSVNQNLYPQQHSKASWARDRKSVPEKDINRPQLHIFIPPLPSKDFPEEVLSEYFLDLRSPRNLIPPQKAQQSIDSGRRNIPGGEEDVKKGA